MIEKLGAFCMLILILALVLFTGGCKSDGSSTETGLLNNITTPATTETTTANTSANTPATLSGYVVDDNTGAPLVGARIWIETYGNAYTGEDGRYTLSNILLTNDDGTIPTDSVLTKSLTVYAEKNNYTTMDYAVQVRNGATFTADFRLKSK